MPKPRVTQQPRDSNQNASGETGAVHKLARIVFAVLTRGEAYDDRPVAA